MFIIDFGSSEDSIRAAIKNRNNPTWEVPVFDFIYAWLDESVQTFEVKTSGSTGTPKVISHTRGAMIASAEKTCDFFALKAGDAALLALPATHIGGKMMIVRSIVRKLRLICIEPKSDPLAGLGDESKIALAALTPMQMSAILDYPASAAKASTISTIILGGGEVSYTLRERLQGISPKVYETYGMTETISHIALRKINGEDKSEYFTILDGVTIWSDDRGCLIISAPHLSATDVVTNDIVKIIDSKRFQWLGRYDHIINTGGIKVSAEEIERKLQPYISGHFFITGMPDDALGQAVTLVVESDASETAIREQYADVLYTHLEKYEKPRRIIVRHSFIYTANGKVNKGETIK